MKTSIAAADRVANPGCYATGFISLVAPLVAGGIASPEYPFVCHALSGSSGAGKKGIAQYLSPERVAVCGLKAAPIFSPVICDYYAGMCVAVPIHASLLSKKYNLNDLHKYFTQYYAEHTFIKVVEDGAVPDFLASNKIVGSNNLEIYVTGNDEQMVLFSVFDNLGKGASGAAVQNMNIMLGFPEDAGLR